MEGAERKNFFYQFDSRGSIRVVYKSIIISKVFTAKPPARRTNEQDFEEEPRLKNATSFNRFAN